MNLPYATDLIPLSIGIAAVCLVVGTVIIIQHVRKDGFTDLVPFGTVVFLFIAALLAGLPMLFSHFSRVEARQAWMDETYGVQFSEAQYSELEFPVWSEPTEDRKVYGLTTGNRDNQLVTVQLVWQDDQFILVGDDGKQLDALTER